MLYGRCGDVGKLCREAQYAGGLDKSLMLGDWNAPPTAGKLHVACAGSWILFIGCIAVLCSGSVCGDGGGDEQQNGTNACWNDGRCSTQGVWTRA
jgi:hypothetical protein